jgi:phosphonate transport system permease protein
MSTPRQRLFSAIGGVAIDALAGAYAGLILVRVVVPSVIYGAEGTGPLSVEECIAMALGTAGCVLLGLFGAGIGRSLLERPQRSGWQAVVTANIGWFVFALTVVAGWVYARIDPSALFSAQGLQGAGRIFSALLSPEFDIIGEALRAMVETIYLAFMATFIAVPFSFAISFFCARNLMNDAPHRRAIYVFLRFLTNFSRSIEPLIWAIVFSVWVGIGPFAGMLALVVHTIASLTKQYAEQIEDVDHGPMEAIAATGARRSQVIWFSVVPQCVIPFLSFTIYRWDINVRMATIIGLVGGGGIGNMLIQYQGLARWNEVGMIVIIIAIVVWIMDVVSARVREALK